MSRLHCTRKQGQALVLTVGERKIIVEFSRVNGSQVRMSVTADKDVSIKYQDVLPQMTAEAANGASWPSGA